MERKQHCCHSSGGADMTVIKTPGTGEYFAMVGGMQGGGINNT